MGQLNQGSAISCSSDGKCSLGCISSVVSISLLIAVWQIYKAFKKRQNIKLKQKYFKRNGGLLLQIHSSDNHGGQGTVYKGMLMDGNIVAVKKSRMLEGNRFDEKKVEHFINEENLLFDILDSTIVNDSPMEEITAMAKLARRCLNLNGKKRPAMKQVAMELELIRASEAGVAIEECGDEESEKDEIIESWNANLSWSTSISITTESTTLPLNTTF
ncbi:hypothetical protein V6N13_149748 [Hibiscus sabdariffa]|uniref:Uncharacterized protein n=1 Tax=Hibiscus sabdariffa TaxID=183260 RepID=A0ABR2EHX0_9ROSI